MAVGYKGLPVLHPVDGVRLAAVKAGIKKPDRYDLVVMGLCEGARAAAVFTRNQFCAAPVTVARTHLAGGAPRYLVINTGYANAGTGARGMQDALAACAHLAQAAACPTEAVLPFSTGVIGEPLPVARLAAALPDALRVLDRGNWALAATGIMTTDTVPKGASRQVDIGGTTITVTGIAKGAGMIRPDMATMLAFIATDAPVAPGLLQQCIENAADESFNRITIDGDTSTNDACVLIATGRAPIATIAAEAGEGYALLSMAITEVALELAQTIVRDGEGATKFLTVEVHGGADREECDRVAYAIAHSPLVKTALFASDPNWGRILAAVGRAGIVDLDVQRVALFLDDVCIARAGERAADYTEEQGRAVMAKEEITVRVELARGHATSRVWTCDFSYDYVRINAEYRT